MLISMFLPMLILIALEYFIFFQGYGKSDTVANSATVILAGLAY